MDDELKYIILFLTLFFIIPVLITSIIEYGYIKKNNAPISCIFAQDMVTCVQISKKEQE